MSTEDLSFKSPSACDVRVESVSVSVSCGSETLLQTSPSSDCLSLNSNCEHVEFVWVRMNLAASSCMMFSVKTGARSALLRLCFCLRLFPRLSRLSSTPRSVYQISWAGPFIRINPAGEHMLQNRPAGLCSPTETTCCGARPVTMSSLFWPLIGLTESPRVLSGQSRL